MSDNVKTAEELADDLARKTAQAVKDQTRITTQNLEFDSEPQSFLKALDDLADDGQ